MFVFQSDFTRLILLYVGLSHTYLFTEAIQDGYDKCLFFRTISSLRLPSKWDPLLAAYRQINDSESKYADLPFKHLRTNFGKRSLSTLAKNDDMPSTHFQDGHDESENGDSSYRYDNVDKKVLNKMVKYLQHVKRRNNFQKFQSRDYDSSVKESLDPMMLKSRFPGNANEPSNVKILTEDYIICNNGNDGSAETYENLRAISNMLQQSEVYCDHNEIVNDKDKISLAFNCVIKRYPYDAPYSDKLAVLKDKVQDTDFLSLMLNAVNNEQAMQMLKTFYPRMDKRFMGRIPEMGPRFTTPPTRRHGR